MIKVKDIPDNKEILVYMSDEEMLFEERNNIGNFVFEEFDYPDYENLLKAVRVIEAEVGIKKWQINNTESPCYAGFSLTYNPDFVGEADIFHQTMGSKKVIDNFSRNVNGATNLKILKNTYYDTYGFRKRHPIIEQYFGGLFSKIKGAIVRSRVAYLYSDTMDVNDPKRGWHIDEKQDTMLRFIVPVKTTDNFILEMDGEDSWGNNASFVKKLELGKAYIWNNRIPHRVHALEHKPEEDPRINVIVGFSPWFDYDETEDAFLPNENYGKTVEEIVKGRLFLR